MRKGMNNKRFGSRFIAFFVTLAMVLSLCTPFAFAADVTGELFGNVYVNGINNGGSLETQQGSKLEGIFNFSNQETSEADARIYFGDRLDLITFQQFSGMQVGGYLGTYTIAYDTQMGEYYISLGQLSGAATSFELDFSFNTTALNGESVTFKLYHGTTKVDKEVGKNNEFTVVAKADAEWTNIKNTDYTNIVLNSEATALSDITYTITEKRAEIGNNSQLLGIGETAIHRYTVTDTITLPDGLYINANSNAEEAIRAAYKITNIEETYTIDDIKYANDAKTQIKGFTVSWTRKNDGADNAAPMLNQEYVATLSGSKVVAPKGFQAGTVSNSVVTKYVTKICDETGTVVENVKTTKADVAETVVSRAGKGMGGVTKQVHYLFENPTVWRNSDNKVEGYVVAGDKIKYEISIYNDSEKEQTYTITDLLSDYNLSLVEFGDNEWYISEQDRIVFDTNGQAELTVPADTEKKFYLTVVVNEDIDTTITNAITVELDGMTMDATSQEITQKKKTPDLEISKETSLEGNIYKPGTPFNYIIKIKNPGSGVADEVKFEDLVPLDATVNGAVTWSYDGTTDNAPDVNLSTVDNSVTGSIKGLDAGKTLTITIPVTPNEDSIYTTITNTAYATLVGGVDGTEDLKKEATVTVKRNTSAVSLLTIKKSTTDQIVSAGDTVTYTVTIENYADKGAVEDATFYVKDILPEGMIYEEGPGTVYLNNGIAGSISKTAASTNEAPVFELSGVTIPNKGTISFNVVCKMTEAAAGNTALTNNVELYEKETDSTPITSGSHSGVIRPDDTDSANGVSIVKTAWDANGNQILDGTPVEAGTAITFKFKITNNSSVDLREFTLSDFMTGNFADGSQIKLIDKSAGTTVLKADGSSYNNGEALFGGNSLGVNSQIVLNFKLPNNEYDFYDGWTWQLNNQLAYSGLTIPPSGWIEIGYTVVAKAAVDWWDDTYFTSGKNEVIIDAGDLGTDYSKVEFPEKPEETDPPTDPDAPIDPGAAKSTLAISKDVITAKGLHANDEDTADAAKYTYTVTLKNTSTESYTIKAGDVFKDAIPAGMALDCTANYDWNDVSNEALVKIVRCNGFDGQSNGIYYTSDINVGSYATYIAKISGTKDNVEQDFSSGRINTQLALEYAIPVSYSDNVASEYNKETKIDIDSLNVSFTEDITLAQNESLQISYTLTTSNDEVGKIVAEINEKGSFTDRAYKNEATFDATLSGNVFKNEKGAVVSKITAVETVELISPEIHPGIEKKAVKAISSLDSENDNLNIKSQNDVFVWKVVVYNAKDHANGGKTLKNYIVKDVYPQYYAYHGKSYTNNHSQAPITYNAEFKLYGGNGEDITPSSGYVEPNANGVFDFSSDAYAIPAGGRLEFTVITKPTVGEKEVTPYGKYTNTVTLVPTQTFERANVSAGTISDDGKSISASDTIYLYNVSTISNKTITLKNDPSKTASSNSSALENRIGAKTGDVVTYTLEVENLDTAKLLEDFSIIDRLPYEGDVGVVTSEDRGSMFPVEYVKDSMKAYVTLKNGKKIEVTEYINTAFASGSKETFTSADIDWLDTSASRASTRVKWVNEPSESTNLVRFCLSKLSSYNEAGENPFAKTYTEDDVSYTKYGVPPEAKIEITFDAKIREYIQDSGEGNYAWNSFGYYFNSGDYENMIAEPAKVGLWVEDDNYGGSILVRKIYKTNMPNLERTFYFALFKGEYNPDTNPNPIDTAVIEMKGSESGAQATTYFTNIDFNNEHTEFYIYETDSNYVPLVANNLVETTKDYVDVEGNSYGQKKYITYKEAIGADSLPLTMDNTSQMDSAFGKQTEGEFNGEVVKYIDNYLVWHKDLSPDKTTNSAIFTNEYFATINKSIMGPFYADVPTDASVATNSGHNMTSTRPETFQAGKISETVNSANRDMSYAKDATYSAEKAGTAYGEKYQHTIATGFLALIEAVGNYTIEQAQWKITTSNPNSTDTPGVFVRLRTEQPQGYGLRLMYLDEFEVFEEESEGKVELGSVGGFEDISDDENFLSDYTVEERAAMIAESLGIDPANIQYDDYGVPYVEMDEELQDEAFALSEVAESTGTTYSNFIGEVTDSGFADARTTDGYVIYKLSGEKKYTMEFNDNIPHITLAAGAQAYVGIVIDQLYDQKATATLEISDVPLYDDDTMIKAANAANGDNGDNQYTMVKSPFQKGGFSIGALLKMSYNKPLYFGNFVETTTKFTEDIQNADNSMRITATEGKNTTVNVRRYPYYAWANDTLEAYDYSSYVSLNGSGRTDYRSIVLNVPKGATLRVIAKSSGDDARTLVVEDSAGEKQNIKVPGKGADDEVDVLKEQTVTIETAGAVYIYSANSGIDVFSVEIVQ